MSLVTGICADNTLTLHLVDRLDSTTAADVEEEIEAIRSDAAYDTIVIDCSKLTYVSSAGLRVLLRLKKSFPNLSLIEASTEVYEVFDMTGLVEIMDIQKAYRRISVDGCKVVGEGASGKIYRIAPDTVVKVFESDVSLDEIQLSRELSRKAFVWGIPTAIPYDVVRVGEHYGAVYELLDAENLAQAIAHGELTVSEVAVLSADLLKQIHGTEVATNMLPSAKAVGLGWAGRLKRHLQTGIALCLVLEPARTPEHQRRQVAGGYAAFLPGGDLRLERSLYLLGRLRQFVVCRHRHGRTRHKRRHRHQFQFHLLNFLLLSLRRRPSPPSIAIYESS